MSGDYHTLDDAYSEYRVLEGYREYPDNNNLYQYQVKGSLITDNGSEYPFVHSHGGNRFGGRPLPRILSDCPHPYAKIDRGNSEVAGSGECMDICRADKDCPVGYHCSDVTHTDNLGNVYGHCLRDRCSEDKDCENGSTCEKKAGQTKGLCSLIPCDLPTTHGNDLYVDDNHLVHGYRKLNKAEGVYNQCQLSSHYNLKRRNHSDVNEPKFNDMY